MSVNFMSTVLDFRSKTAFIVVQPNIYVYKVLEQKTMTLRFVIREQSDYQSLTTMVDNVCRGRLKISSSVRTAVITSVNQPGTQSITTGHFGKCFNLQTICFKCEPLLEVLLLSE